MVEKPTILEVLPLLKAYYLKPGNVAGGSLHVVLEDGNYDTDHVQWCIDHARLHGDFEGVNLAELLLLMSRTQRRKLASLL